MNGRLAARQLERGRLNAKSLQPIAEVPHAFDQCIDRGIFAPKVKISGEVAKTLAKDHADMKNKFVFQDWKKINEQRSSWIEKFNRDIKI